MIIVEGEKPDQKKVVILSALLLGVVLLACFWAAVRMSVLEYTYTPRSNRYNIISEVRIYRNGLWQRSAEARIESSTPMYSLVRVRRGEVSLVPADPAFTTYPLGADVLDPRDELTNIPIRYFVLIRDGKEVQRVSR